MGNEDRATYLRNRFGRSQSFLNWREKRFVTDMLAMMERPLSHILDVPCGHGRFTPQLRPEASERLVCGDLLVEHIEALLAAESDNGTPIETVQIDLFKPFPFDNEEFDLVFNFRFLHHVRKDEQRQHLIKELVRVAKRYLVISYYETAPIHALQKRLWRREGHYPDLPMVPREDFHGLFAQQGCRLLDDRGVLPGIHAHRVALFERHNGAS